MKINKYKETFSEKIQKNKLLLIVLLVIWAVIAFLSIYSYRSSLGMKSYGNDNSILDIYEINEDNTFVETIKIKENINSISLKFGTFARRNEGHIYIEVLGVNTRTLYLKKTIDVKDINDNAFTTFGFTSKILKNTDPNIQITLSSDSTKGKGVGIYYSLEDGFEESTLTLNKRNIQGDIKVRFLFDNEVLMSFNDKVLIFSLIGFTLIVLIIIFFNRKEILYTSLVFIIGLVFMCVITPMSPPDEQTHYEYSFQLTNYIFGEDHLIMNERYQDYGDFGGHINVSSAYESFEEEMSKELKLKDNNVTLENDVLDATYFLCYIPQVIGITISRLLKLNMLKTFYSGRFCNLVFYCFCIYIAIKKTPIHKNMLGIMASMPIMIQQAASYSYDTFLNGLLLVLAGYLFNFLSRDEEDYIRTKEIVVLFIALMFLTPLKVVYSLFAFCLLFVPYSRFKTKGRKFICLSILLIPVFAQLAILLVPYASKLFEGIGQNNFTCFGGNTISLDKHFGILKEIAYNGDDSRDLYTIEYMSKHVGETFLLFAKTIRFYIKLWFYGALGRCLSGESLVLPVKFVHMMVIILLVSSFIRERYVIPVKVKISFVVISIFIGLFVLSGMLLTWTFVGDEMIQGIQGRYFSPLLFYCLTVFSNKKFSLPKSIDKYLIFSQSMLLFEVILFVMSYTFIN